MPARRHTQVAAVAALLAAIVGGAYAAQELRKSSAAPTSGRGVITCPPTAHGWKGRVTGVRVAPQAPLREARIVQLVNAFRAANMVAPLRPSAGLTEAARAHSADMLARHYFAHDAPTGGTFTQRLARYDPQTCIAENIAWGSGSYGTAAGLVTAWKNSPAHRHIMLLRYVTRIGVGIRVGTFLGANGAAVATADFAG